jgi:LPXTG-motif cell wall-anchored protein
VNTKKQVVTILGLALLFALAIPGILMADDWDKATKLTFSEPVEVPGVVLPAGTYWFTLSDSEADRNIVQIWNADRTRLITTVLAIADYRQHPTGKTVVHFEERPSNSPEAIHSWFYPGANFGEEFVYPKARATQLAKQVSRPVLSMPDAQPSDATQIKLTPVKAVSPSGEEIEISEIIATQEVLPTEAAPTPTSLPKTGSSLPLLLLAGLFSLGAAGVIRGTARRME